MKKIFLLILLTFGLLNALAVPPKAKGFYVNDKAGLLSASTISYIIKINEKLSRATGAQVVVMTIPSLEGEGLEEYATKVFNAYAIGDKTKQNGVLMLLARDERKFRIATGHGVEGFLPDGKTGRIQDEFIIPYLKNNQWDRGVVRGFDEIIAQIAKEYGIDAKALTSEHKYANDEALWLDDGYLGFVEAVSAKLKKLTGTELIIKTSASDEKIKDIVENTLKNNENAVVLGVSLYNDYIDTSLMAGNNVPMLPSVFSGKIAGDYIFKGFEESKAQGVKSGAGAVIEGIEKDLNIRLIDKMPSLNEGEFVLDLAGILDDRTKAEIEQKGAELYAKTGKKLVIATTSDFILPYDDYKNSNYQMLRALKRENDIHTIMVLASYNGKTHLHAKSELYAKEGAINDFAPEALLDESLGDKGALAIYDHAAWAIMKSVIFEWLKWWICGGIVLVYIIGAYKSRKIVAVKEKDNKVVAIMGSLFVANFAFIGLAVYFVDPDESMLFVAVFLLNFVIIAWGLRVGLAEIMANRSGSGSSGSSGGWGDSGGGGSTGGGGSSRSF